MPLGGLDVICFSVRLTFLVLIHKDNGLERQGAGGSESGLETE